MAKRRLVIAIDGPAGSGKSSTARALAKRLKVAYIDSGAMYRALTLKAMRQGIDLTDIKKLVRLAKNIRITFGPIRELQKVYLDGKDVTKAIRTPELTQNVVYVAREPKIRAELVKKQRAMGRKFGGVMEGRDIGSVVLPNADFKFYFDADPKLRARRRYKELVAAGKRTPYAKVLKDLLARDKSDRVRKAGALKVAKGARVLDTTGLTIPATIDRILEILKGKA